MSKMCVIMACFNEIELTKQAVESIMENSNNKHFFVFIDNGSTDGTFEFLSAVPNSYTIRNPRNTYVNPAWNQGFKYFLSSDFEYCCLINNDIVVAENWLECIFWGFENRRGEIYIPSSNTDSDREYINWQEYQKYYEGIKNEKCRFSPVHKTFTGFCIFLKRKCVEGFYPIPENMKILGGDAYIVDYCYNNGYVPTKVSHCSVGHVWSATQKRLKHKIHNIRNSDLKKWKDYRKSNWLNKGYCNISERKPRTKLL